MESSMRQQSWNVLFSLASSELIVASFMRFAFRQEMASADRFPLRFFLLVLGPNVILAMPNIFRHEMIPIMDAPTRKDVMYPPGGSLDFFMKNILTASK